jgi:hypothetical protein
MEGVDATNNITEILTSKAGGKAAVRMVQRTKIIDQPLLVLRKNANFLSQVGGQVLVSDQ